MRGAGILAVCAMAAKLVGAMYRVPLTNIIGSQGMGLYHMIFPLYTVLLTISSGGLPVAISRVVSARMAKNDEKGARAVLAVSLVSLTLIGLVAGGAVALLRNQIASVQGNSAAAMPYLGIAPSIVFVAVISCFRGYYQGKQNMLPSAISQLTEQIVKVAAGLTLARFMLPLGVEYAVLGALIGVSASELLTMLILAVQFYFTNRRYKKRTRISVFALNTEAAADTVLAAPPSKPQKIGSLLKEIYKVAIPVTLGSLVMPLTQVIDSILVINMLTAGGVGRTAATSLFGLMAGPVGTLLNMPVVVTLSFSVALLPKVSECFTKGECAGADIGRSLKFNMILGLLATLTFAVFAGALMRGFYSRGLSATEIRQGTTLLIIGSISVLYISLLQVATAVLQGTNRAHKPAVNLLYGAVLKIILSLALLPFFGVAGAMAASAACYGLVCVLDIRAMRKIAAPNIKLREFLIGPLIAGAAFIATGLVLLYVLSPRLSAVWSAVIAAGAAVLVYFAALIATKSIRAADLKEFPLLGKLIKKIAAKKQKTADVAAQDENPAA